MVNRNEMVDAIDMEAYVDYLGIEKRRAGTRTFIRCPSHLKNLGKEDRKISNAVICGKGYYCYACGEYHSVIDMAQMVLGCDFKGAVKNIEKFLGKNYEIEGDKKDPLSDKCPLSKDELRLIGFDLKKGFSRAYTGVTAEGELKYESAYTSIDQLYRENPAGFRYMVGSKALFTREKYFSLAKQAAQGIFDEFCEKTTVDPAGLLQAFIDKTLQCEEILKKLKISPSYYQKCA